MTLTLLLALLPFGVMAQSKSLKECLDEFSKINRANAPRTCPKPHSMPGLTSAFREHNADCSKFIGDDGSYGSWGQSAADYIRAKGSNSSLFSNNLTGMAGTGGICPKWNTFDNEQKIHFWVWTLASIAWKEATCKENARNGKASNGVAVGLLQLDEGTKNRSWRGPSCKVPSVAKASENLKCGLDIMEDLMEAKSGVYKSNGLLYGRKNNSYWEQLRHSDGGEIGRRIRAYPPCGN